MALAELLKNGNVLLECDCNRQHKIKLVNEETGELKVTTKYIQPDESDENESDENKPDENKPTAETKKKKSIFNI